MYTQILSKNELVINAEEEKREEGREKTRPPPPPPKKKKEKKKKKKKKKKNGHSKHGEKNGKTGGTATELPTNTAALSKKQNKARKKSMKTTERKVKAER